MSYFENNCTNFVAILLTQDAYVRARTNPHMNQSPIVLAVELQIGNYMALPHFILAEEMSLDRLFDLTSQYLQHSVGVQVPPHDRMHLISTESHPTANHALHLIDVESWDFLPPWDFTDHPVGEYTRLTWLNASHIDRAHPTLFRGIFLHLLRRGQDDDGAYPHGFDWLD